MRDPRAAEIEQAQRRAHGERLIDIAVKRMTGHALFAGGQSRVLAPDRFRLVRSVQHCAPVIRIAR